MKKQITEQFIRDNASGNGGWTKAQARALGIPYPFQSGWIERIVGTYVDESAMDDFVAARGQLSKATISMRERHAKKQARKPVKNHSHKMFTVKPLEFERMPDMYNCEIYESHTPFGSVYRVWKALRENRWFYDVGSTIAMCESFEHGVGVCQGHWESGKGVGSVLSEVDPVAASEELEHSWN